MVCYCLDLRPDSAGAKFLANKLVSVIAGILQFVIWVSALFAFIVQPEPLKQQIQSSPAGAIAVAVILILICIAFSVFLLIGLFKNRIWYVKVFLVYMVVVLVLLVVSVVVNVCTQPARFGLSGFLSNLLTILINVLTYFIIRNYYLAVTSSKNQNQNHKQHLSPNRV